MIFLVDGGVKSVCLNMLRTCTKIKDNVMISMLYMYMYIGDSNRFPYANSPFILPYAHTTLMIYYCLCV